jgi:hypothetical protein
MFSPFAYQTQYAFTERNRNMFEEQHCEKTHLTIAYVPNTGKTHKLKAHHKIPVRHGVSQYVLETAKRLKEEYQTDLDYLQEH